MNIFVPIIQRKRIEFKRESRKGDSESTANVFSEGNKYMRFSTEQPSQLLGITALGLALGTQAGHGWRS